MVALQHYVLSYLPPDVQAIILDPPSLSNPTSILRVLKAVFPYARYIIILLAVYIVWSAIAGVIGYFSRFMRFALRIGPIIGLIGWVMASSGQGSLDELFAVVKQWTGFSPGDFNPAQMSPGIASIANLLGANQAQSASSKRPRREKSSSSTAWGKSDPVSSRTRNKKGPGAANDNAASDFISSVIGSATGVGQDAEPNYWQSMVQDYVKDAVAKAAGLEWLMGKSADAEASRNEKGWWKTR